ncbi:MAG: TM2 domain-containing protein [Oscillospiraceae bacterium]|nr:TM2 domain-containing protein [Oscillospiraceae bacterium]
METQNEQNTANQVKTKFCKHCGAKIPEAAIICTACGCQVEEMKSQEQPNIVINNANTNSNVNTNQIGGMYMGRPRNKWVAFLLCFFLGYLGAHKFYEGKAGMGILYLFTVGLFGIGWFIDCISILCKANPYYVKY